MQSGEPDYASYTLEELQDALQHIDANAYPDRAERLTQEIRRHGESSTRVPVVDTSTRDITLSLAGRRLAAFVGDVVLLGLVWMVIDNLMLFPWFRWTSTLVSLALFVVYFTAFESMGPERASLGKRQLGITVNTDGLVTMSQGLVRALIVSAIVWVDWAAILSFRPLDRLPLAFGAVMAGMQIGLWIYAGVLLFWLVPNGQLLQDRATGTHVRIAKEPPTVVPASTAPRWAGVALVASLLAGTGLTVGFAAGMTLLTGQDPVEQLISPLRDTTEMNDAIATEIAEGLSVRTRVRVETERTWTTGEPRRDTLKLVIWIPAVRWTQSTREGVLQSVLDVLGIEPGAYDDGELVLWTGGSGLSISHTYTLNLP